MLLAGFRAFPEVRNGHLIWLLAFVPVWVFLGIFEIAMWQTDLSSAMTWVTTEAGAKPSFMIYYIATAALHTVTCSFFIIQFLRSAYFGVSHQKQIQIKFHAILAFLAVTGTFTAIVIFFDTRLEQLSHQFLYSILKKHSFYGELFVCVLGETVSGECSGFYAFSVIPMFLIVFGHLATVVVIFDIGSRVSELDSVTDETVWKEKVSFVVNLFREKFYALSAILFTSSVCTTYYFHLPLSVIADEEGISAYRSFASSMSLTWGITFSLTLCAIIVLPYLRYRSRLYSMSIIRRGQAPNEADGLIAINEGYLILKEHFGFVLSSLLPVVASVVGTVLN